VNEIDFIWSGEVVSMIEKEGKYHIKLNCSSQLVELAIPEKTRPYRLGDKIIIRGHIRIMEIFRGNNTHNRDSNLS